MVSSSRPDRSVLQHEAYDAGFSDGLAEGRCRFNCRKMSEVWDAAWQACLEAVDSPIGHELSIRKASFQKWKASLGAGK